VGLDPDGTAGNGYLRIMVHYQVSIRGRANVELHKVGAQGGDPVEVVSSVILDAVVAATVRDLQYVLWSPCAGRLE
jgi:hypothetical protein